MEEKREAVLIIREILLNAGQHRQNINQSKVSGNSTPRIPLFCLFNTVQNKIFHLGIAVVLDQCLFYQILDGLNLHRAAVFAQFIYIGFDFCGHLP